MPRPRKNIKPKYKTIESRAVIYPPFSKIKDLTEKQKNRLNFLRQYGQFFDEPPVTIGEFINSPDYLNLEGVCRQRIRRELINIFGDEVDPYSLSKNLYALITGGIGLGKCHKKGTQILMYDGSLKKVEDIKIGDLLMGDDGDYRTVLNLSRGKEMMYWVRQKKGMDYCVNESHILSLKKHNGDIVDIDIKTYLSLNNREKLHGWKSILSDKKIIFTDIKLEKDCVDKYYGFELDKNHRYLLKDFTVCHNSFAGGIIFSYLVYRLLCIKNPQAFYGFAPNTRLSFMNMCLDGDEEVYLSDGSRLKMKDIDLLKNKNVLSISNIDKYNKNNAVIDVKKIKKSVYTGYKKAYKLSLKNGTSIIATNNHPFFVKNKGWTALSDLIIGEDELMTVNFLPINGKKEIPENEVKILAYLIGNGCTKNPSVSFSSSNKKVLKEYEEACLLYPDIKHVRKVLKKNKKTFELITAIKKMGNRFIKRENPIKTLCIKYGLYGKTALKKRIPAKIFQLNDNLLKIFISRLWATDGCIYARDNESCCLVYSTSSPELALDVKNIMMYFNIPMRILERRTDYGFTKGKKTNKGYQVYCGEQWAIKKFIEEIGIFGREEKCQKFLKMIKIKKEYKNKKITYSGIKSIKFIGKRKVYDVEVEDTHNFIVNGIVCHNSTSKNNAMDVLFGEVKARIETSPWFMKGKYLPDPRFTNILKFPKNVFVIPGDSSETTFEGYNIIGGILDEADSHKITSRKDYADQGFDTIKIRVTSRSNPKFGHIGFLLVIGSKKKQKGFIARKYEEFKNMPDAYAVHLPIWEARDKSDFTRKKNFYFNVLTKEPCEFRDWNSGNNPIVLKIPIEYGHDFLTNPDKALRDLAGYPPYARQPFFSLVEKIQTIGSSGVIQNPVKQAVSTEIVFHNWFIGGNHKYYVHFDLGLNKDGGDFCGMAMGHLADYQKVDNEMKPIVHMDLMLRIEASPAGEIIISQLRRVIYDLKDNHGFNIVAVTFDGWESSESIQQLKKKRINAKIISIDRTNECYDDLKDVLYEDRFVSYYYQPFIDECLELEHTDSGKIDHPAFGCFTGETRVALADGTNPTFKELAERKKEFYVYSINKEGICITEARNARITKKATELAEIVLDNFQVIRCTPEHLFMTLDGGWIQAKNLTMDIPIMPLYRARCYKGGYADYERVWCPIKRKRILTHHLAVGGCSKGMVVHHKDEIKHNNNPKNLQLMTISEHYYYHGNNNWDKKEKKMRKGHEKYRNDKNAQLKHSERMKKKWQEGVYGEKAKKCAIENCENISEARGLCDLHYQRAKRAKILPETIGKTKKNHRILSVKIVNVNEDVYDLTVPKTENFALTSGVFVHNSKDVADAVASVTHQIVLNRRRASMVINQPIILGDNRMVMSNNKFYEKINR